MKLVSIATLSAVARGLPRPEESKPVPEDDPFRQTDICEDFCLTRDCSNRGSKNAEIFIPFGTAHGDTEGVRRDDIAEGPIVLANDVPYFGRHYNDIFFSSNGAITFGSGLTAYTSEEFPNNKHMFSPFWADFNTEISGHWYYRELSAADLVQASDIVNFEHDEFTDFAGVDGVVVTYDKIAHYGRSPASDRENKMQAILVHDNNHSFAIFQYGDIEWTAGYASAGDVCDGLGGTPAQVGFNDGHGNFYSVAGSRTDDMQFIDDKTNCKTTGRFIFKVDGEVIEAEDPVTLPPVTGVDISIEFPVIGISDYIPHRGGEGMFDTVISHGCYCSGNLPQGAPVDELDKICRDWLSKRRCVIKNGGTCHSGPALYTSFTPSDCSAKDTDCESLVCDLDEIYFGEIQNYLDNNPNWTPVVEATCGPRSTDPNFSEDNVSMRRTHEAKDSCCGTSAMTLVDYNSNTNTCVMGELV